MTPDSVGLYPFKIAGGGNCLFRAQRRRSRIESRWGERGAGPVELCQQPRVDRVQADAKVCSATRCVSSAMDVKFLEGAGPLVTPCTARRSWPDEP